MVIKHQQTKHKQKEEAGETEHSKWMLRWLGLKEMERGLDC